MCEVKVFWLGIHSMGHSWMNQRRDQSVELTMSGVFVCLFVCLFVRFYVFCCFTVVSYNSLLYIHYRLPWTSAVLETRCSFKCIKGLTCC